MSMSCHQCEQTANGTGCPNAWRMLQENWNIMPTGEPEADIRAILGGGA